MREIFVTRTIYVTDRISLNGPPSISIVCSEWKGRLDIVTYWLILYLMRLSSPHDPENIYRIFRSRCKTFSDRYNHFMRKSELIKSRVYWAAWAVFLQSASFLDKRIFVKRASLLFKTKDIWIWLKSLSTEYDFWCRKKWQSLPRHLKLYIVFFFFFF